MRDRKRRPARRSPHKSATDVPRPIYLRKGDARWVFRYGAGEEGALLACVSNLARDPKSELDWVDAAIVSHEISRRIAADHSAPLREPKPPPRAGPPSGD